MAANVRSIVIPKLGKVTGLYDSEAKVTRFLGIPYGSVSKRWTRAAAIDHFPSDTFEATKYGPICPQVYIPDMPSISQMAVPGFAPNPTPSMDEFACLNMNIVKPETNAENLPVLVWIHGGGFAVGSNSELVYDGAELCKKSIESETPVIYVAINYRLGFFGFLASKQLKEENNGKAVGNYGLFDQRLALEFLQEHISAFGGNPKAVTIFGESAGAASVHAHLLAGKELFQQAICQSGVVRTLGPLNVENPYMNGAYDAMSKFLSEDRDDGPEALRGVSAESIVCAMAEYAQGAPICACFITDDTSFDESFFPSNTDWVSIPSFCKRLIIGDCMIEGIITAQNLMKIPLEDIEKALFAPSGLSRDYLAKFALASPEQMSPTIPGPPVFTRLVDLQTEVAFFGPVEEVISRAPRESTYVYRFDRANSWRGSGDFLGLAHHTIDLLYLAGVPRKIPTIYPAADVEISERMITQWVDFAVGKEPWTPTGEEGWEMCYKQYGGCQELKKVDVRTRDFASAGHIMGENWEKVLKLNVAFSVGKVLPWA